MKYHFCTFYFSSLFMDVQILLYKNVGKKLAGDLEENLWGDGLDSTIF